MLHAYSPPLAGNAGRALAAVEAVERAFPRVRFAWEISEEGQAIALTVTQRNELLATEARRGDLPLLCNGDETYPVTVSGSETPAGIAPGRRPLLQISVDLPLEMAAIAAAVDILEGVADASHAFWGRAAPLATGAEIASQVIHPARPGYPQERPPRGLPALKREPLASPEIPVLLGWLNYWSPAAAAAIGFPDPARDADLLARARRTARGAWILKLTDEPLDLDIPAHLDALKRAYDRFPAIGARMDR